MTLHLFQTLGFFYFQQSNSDSGSALVCCLIPVGIVIAIISISVWSSNNQKAEALRRDQEKTANMSDEEKEKYYKEQKERKIKAQKFDAYGNISPEMICPHCQTKGKVRTKTVTQKKGISGSKATGAVLTGGISILATGLSRKEDATQAHCENCSNTWFF